MPCVGLAFTDSALDFLGNLPTKIRRQVVKKSKALQTNPFPKGSKKLRDVNTSDGDSVYRERSGDYRILYVVRSNPKEVLILDIDHRKDIYRTPKTKTKRADEMRMRETEFDDVMREAIGVPPQPDNTDVSANPKKKRLSAYPRKKKKN